MTERITELYKQLCQFGLDSKEWIIKPISKNLFEIYHSEDPNFKFLGKARSQTWNQIWLHSL